MSYEKLQAERDVLEVLIVGCQREGSIPPQDREKAIREAAARVGMRELERVGVTASAPHEGYILVSFTLEQGNRIEPAGLLYVGLGEVLDEWRRPLDKDRERGVRNLIAAGDFYESISSGVAFGGVPVHTREHKTWETISDWYEGVDE